jgi:hypothetical protein
MSEKNSKRGKSEETHVTINVSGDLVCGDKQVVNDSVIMERKSEEHHRQSSSSDTSMDRTVFGKKERDGPVFTPRKPDSVAPPVSHTCKSCGNTFTGNTCKTCGIPRKEPSYTPISRCCPHCGGRTTFNEHMYCCLDCGKQS